MSWLLPCLLIFTSIFLKLLVQHLQHIHNNNIKRRNEIQSERFPPSYNTSSQFRRIDDAELSRIHGNYLFSEGQEGFAFNNSARPDQNRVMNSTSTVNDTRLYSRNLNVDGINSAATDQSNNLSKRSKFKQKLNLKFKKMFGRNKGAVSKTNGNAIMSISNDRLRNDSPPPYSRFDPQID
ncbi:hypothetical protein KGF54_005371 [Candida jiufengensis]|uniref:uncharacterized protein n=1 Tax=Candida jiufengensis TaxID=497108 RepID=UPI002225824E|nr:uncharacterized protein KGF54_005371 [Candida jiufengensis]KAI5949893.1 hypothetical protein KGF54_005371 [Candida jiufengensis]